MGVRVKRRVSSLIGHRNQKPINERVSWRLRRKGETGSVWVRNGDREIRAMISPHSAHCRRTTDVTKEMSTRIERFTEIEQRCIKEKAVERLGRQHETRNAYVFGESRMSGGMEE